MRCWWGLAEYGGALVSGPYLSTRSRSREDCRSGAVIGPGAPLDLMPPVRAAPARGPHSTNIFPQGSSLGGLQLYPLTGTLPPCWLQGGFIASEAVLCMGGPLLTVGAS